MKVVREHFNEVQAVEKYQLFCKRNSMHPKHIARVEFEELISLYDFFGHMVFAFKPKILTSELARKVEVALPHYYVEPVKMNSRPLI